MILLLDFIINVHICQRSRVRFYSFTLILVVRRSVSREVFLTMTNRTR